MTQRRAQWYVRDTPHTYVTHPMRLIVHFWNIKLLLLVRSLHHFNQEPGMMGWQGFSCPNPPICTHFDGFLQVRV